MTVAQRVPYQLRHVLVHNPDLLKSIYPELTETERLEVLAYVTRKQRRKQDYQDLSEGECLAAAQALLQRWQDWSDAIDGSDAWRFPPHAWKALTKLAQETSSFLEQTQERP